MSSESPLMDSLQIQKILPHRYPFLLLDKVVELTELAADNSRIGRVAKCIKNVTINEPFFEGHFPHRPVMPGVLLIEAMAQAGAIVCSRPDDPEMDTSIVSIKDARFRAPVVPGDTLELYAKVIKDRGKMILLECKAKVDGKVVAETELMAFVVPKSSLKQ